MPMPFLAIRRLLPVICLLGMLAPWPAPYAPVRAATSQPQSISYWGMNAYVTKRERLGAGDNLPVLADTARRAGVQWTREELPWDLIEPSNDSFSTLYDSALKLTADKGFGIIGMLLTTPSWARDRSCQAPGPTYWCPPANVAEYAQFAAWMVERYDGDGVNDAPGSPRIAAWQIWNEPNDPLLWPNIGAGGDARKQRYGEMLVAAYRAIKAADPSAVVLTGGVYIYDGSYCATTTCDGFVDGLVFFDSVVRQVPAARDAFDVFAIHPYIPTARPDAPEIPRLITVEGRIRSSRERLNTSYGRPNAPIWITEMGWCTGPGVCPGNVQVSEDQQANYLTRAMVIAQHNGVQHASWFQFEDAFNDPNREWANAAIVRRYDGAGYPAKPAYFAYRTLAQNLAGAVPDGVGPAHTHVYDPNKPYVNDNGTYDYRYMRGTTVIDVLWRPVDSVQVSFPVDASKSITLVDRDGTQTSLTPSNGVVQVTLSERPIFIVQGESLHAPRLEVKPNSLSLLVQQGAPSTSRTLSIRNGGNGTLSWSASPATPWLQLTQNTGVAPSELQVTAEIRGMAPGAYSGTIRIVGSDGTGSIDVPVNLMIASKLYDVRLPLVRR